VQAAPGSLHSIEHPLLCIKLILVILWDLAPWNPLQRGEGELVAPQRRHCPKPVCVCAKAPPSPQTMADFTLTELATRLETYLRGLPEATEWGGHSGLVLAKVDGGQSNPTYIVKLGSGQKAVLRKKPAQVKVRRSISSTDCLCVCSKGTLVLTHGSMAIQGCFCACGRAGVPGIAGITRLRGARSEGVSPVRGFKV
jgi:hypothetical protein